MLSRFVSKLSGKKAQSKTKQSPTTPESKKASPRLSLHLPSPTLSPYVKPEYASDTKSSLWIDVDSATAQSASQDEASPTVRSSSPLDLEESSQVFKKRLGARIVNAEELLPLLELCCNEIKARGLETLGIFRPHRLAENSNRQNSIIKHYLASIEKEVAPSPTAKASLNDIFGQASSPTEAYQAGMRGSGIHDVVAVLKWALRHFVNSSSSSFLASPSNNWAWYTTFCETETTQNFPAEAYINLFIPLIKPSHQPIFNLIFDLISFIAAHSEANGMSATRLCKTLGYWLLSSRPSHEDVMDLYAEWNKSSIALEHLFLAYLRDLQAKEGIPKRLKELVWNYQGAPRTFDQVAQGAKNALKVLLVVEVEKIERYKSLQPGQIFEACLRASLQAEDSAEADVKAWNEFRKSATSQYPAYAQVLSEDTLRIMGPRSKSKMATGKADSPGRRRSFSVDTPVAPTVPFSLDDNLPPLQENGHSSVDKQPIQFGRFGNKSHSALPSPTEAVEIPSWKEFVDSGFSFAGFPQTKQDLTLRPDYTGRPSSPTSVEKQGKLRKVTPPSRTAYTRHKTAGDLSKSTSAIPESQPEEKQVIGPTAKSLAVSTIHLDEAFVDLFLDVMAETTLRATLWPVFEVAENNPSVIQQSGLRFLLVQERLQIGPPPVAGDSTAVTKPKEDKRKMFATFSRRSSKRISGLPQAPSTTSLVPKRSASLSSLSVATSIKSALKSPSIAHDQSKEKALDPPALPTPDIVLHRPSNDPSSASTTDGYFPGDPSTLIPVIREESHQLEPIEEPSYAADSEESRELYQDEDRLKEGSGRTATDAEVHNAELSTTPDVSIVPASEQSPVDQASEHSLASSPSQFATAQDSTLESLRSDNVLEAVEEQEDEPTTEQPSSTSISAAVAVTDPFEQENQLHITSEEESRPAPVEAILIDDSDLHTDRSESISTDQSIFDDDGPHQNPSTPLAKIEEEDADAPSTPILRATITSDHDILSPLEALHEPMVIPASPSIEQTVFRQPIDDDYMAIPSRSPNRLSQDTVRGAGYEENAGYIHPDQQPVSLSRTKLGEVDDLSTNSQESIESPKSSTSPTPDLAPIDLPSGRPFDDYAVKTGNTSSFTEHLPVTTENPTEPLSTNSSAASSPASSPVSRKSSKVFASAKRVLSTGFRKKKAASANGENETEDSAEVLALYSPVAAHSDNHSPVLTKKLSASPILHSDMTSNDDLHNSSDELHVTSPPPFSEHRAVSPSPITATESSSSDVEVADEKIQVSTTEADTSMNSVSSPIDSELAAIHADKPDSTQLPPVPPRRKTPRPPTESIQSHDDANVADLPVPQEEIASTLTLEPDSPKPMHNASTRPSPPDDLQTPQRPSTDRQPSLPEAIPMVFTQPTAHARSASVVSDPLGHNLASEDLFKSPALSSTSEADDRESTHSFETSASTTNTGRNSFESAVTS